jgi:hypothetical protein
MKRLMIGIAAASLLSAVSFAAQADERGGRHGISRAPSHASYGAHRVAPRHVRPPRRHYAPPRHYGHDRRHGYSAHSGWGRHYVPRYSGYRHAHDFRHWR